MEERGVPEKLFVKHELSAKEISERSEISCSPATIRKWLDKHGIKSKTELSETLLREWYCDKGMSISEIANQQDEHAIIVQEKLHEHGIEMRNRTGTKYSLPRPRTWEDGYERIAFTQSGAQANGNTNPEIRHHRLLMAMNHSLEELKGMHVHHKNHVHWLNYEDNLELLTPEEHARKHGADGDNYEENIYDNLPVEYRYDTTIIEEDI